MSYENYVAELVEFFAAQEEPDEGEDRDYARQAFKEAFDGDPSMAQDYANAIKDGYSHSFLVDAMKRVYTTGQDVPASQRHTFVHKVFQEMQAERGGKQ